MSLVPSKDQGPVADWYLSSENIYEPVYPINVKDEVWFANEEGLLIRFDGWNVTDVENISEEVETVRIASVRGRKSYFFKEIELVANCSDWEKSVGFPNEGIIYKELCVFAEQEFTNRITVNAEGAIVELRFMVYPNKEYFFLRPM